jgi:hypothetical protein
MGMGTECTAALEVVVCMAASACMHGATGCPRVPPAQKAEQQATTIWPAINAAAHQPAACILSPTQGGARIPPSHPHGLMAVDAMPIKLSIHMYNHTSNIYYRINLIIMYMTR